MNGVFKGVLTLCLCAIGFTWLGTAHAASFDCAKARTHVEKMICANSDLSEWDSLMAEQYRLSLIFKNEAEWAKRTQLSWLKQRNKCQDVACVKKAYLDRMYELDNPPGHEGHWINDPYNPGIGQNSALAHALLNRLKSFTWKSNQCSWNVIGTYKGFSQPPWRKLDPNKHLILIYKLLVSDGSVHGLNYYYNGKPRKPMSVEVMRERAEKFVKRGGELLLWHARIFNYYGSRSKPVPPGKQTIVELRTTVRTKGNEQFALSECRDKPKLLWSGSTYIVKPDLTGLDPDMGSAMASWLSSGVLLINQHNLYLYGPGPTVYRIINPKYVTYSTPPSYCAFRYKEFKKEHTK